MKLQKFSRGLYPRTPTKQGGVKAGKKRGRDGNRWEGRDEREEGEGNGRGEGREEGKRGKKGREGKKRDLCSSNGCLKKYPAAAEIDNPPLLTTESAFNLRKVLNRLQKNIEY
jgi:hypothetical protein